MKKNIGIIILIITLFTITSAAMADSVPFTVTVQCVNTYDMTDISGDLHLACNESTIFIRHSVWGTQKIIQICFLCTELHKMETCL